MNNLMNIANSLVSEGDKFLAKHGPLEFHLKAQELLAKASLPDAYDFEELALAAMDAAFKTPQSFGTFQFSDMPLTMAWGEHCFLDLYFWRRRPTVIHDHHFTGAFQCLQGSNLDLEFEFQAHTQIGRFHELGELTLKERRQLKPGAIAPINLLSQFIHQNHHQSDLTVNACFRTPDIGEHNLSHYLYSGMRIEKDSLLLNRVDRMKALLCLGDFELTKAKVSSDDALAFLIENHHSEFRHPHLLKFTQLMQEKVMGEFGLDVKQYLELHEERMEQEIDHSLSRQEN